MRRMPLLALGLALAFIGLRPARGQEASDPLDRRFRETVRPFLNAHCLACHGTEKPKGGLDLGAYPTTAAVARDIADWERVLDQLQSKAMPPSKAKRQPSDDARRDVIAWIKSVRAIEARRNAGDPGTVPARRLSNAEYDHTIRDLTGSDIRPAREFPVDPANEAGFDNSAESLAMSPALVKKYLEAARGVADHAVLTPLGLDFAPHPVVADTDRDKYAVRRIIDFYKRQHIDTTDYFLAAWRYQHRTALGRPNVSLAQVASEGGISPRYLASVWSVLTEPAADVGPIAAIQAMWRDLPPPVAGREDGAKAGAVRMRDLVAELRQALTPEVKNLTSPGVGNGSQSLVLWKDRQFVANRMRYAGNAAGIKPDSLKAGTAEARALALPRDPADLDRARADFARFCATFPDAFFIAERGRVFIEKEDKKNVGRLLNAGFHSMTGYFRDDAPLSALILDDSGRSELDRLWREFHFVTDDPARQYSSFLWFERAETTFLRGDEFAFVRAEDKAAASDPMIRRLADVYLAKARRLGASDRALTAISDQFRIISEELRAVESDRVAAEPLHVAALQAFAGRAFRRPLSVSEREGLAAFYRALRDKEGLGHEEAVRELVVAVLMSPHFCYRVDLASSGRGIRPIEDFALASRLSYFLWSSMPDATLLDLARSGDLHRPEILVAQARRMLLDDRARGLATEFAGNWLDVRRFEEHNGVDRGRFPSFDDALRRAMFEEPIRFFLDVVRRDRPVDDFLTAGDTFVNPTLAKHYGMPVPDSGPDEWVRVIDAARYGRGGLLPMAAFLTKNAPGLRTSPVKRGYWVVRRLLGEHIPPPPADVPELPGDESKLGELTLRQALARHRADKACAGCHERFDAIGLAFEGYGPIGEARLNDLGGHPVDARATFPGGSEGTGVIGLRAYLESTRRDEFVANLCRKLLAYALGRGLIPSDDDTLAAMRSRLAADGGRFGGLVEAIVTSPQFLNTRIESDRAEASR